MTACDDLEASIWRFLGVLAFDEFNGERTGYMFGSGTSAIRVRAWSSRMASYGLHQVENVFFEPPQEHRKFHFFCGNANFEGVPQRYCVMPRQFFRAPLPAVAVQRISPGSIVQRSSLSLARDFPLTNEPVDLARILDWIQKDPSIRDFNASGDVSNLLSLLHDFTGGFDDHRLALSGQPSLPSDPVFP